MATKDETKEKAAGNGAEPESEGTLSITDSRTGENYEVEITDGTIKTMDLRQIKVKEDDFGMMGYDPAFTNTANCRSAITYIDGEALASSSTAASRSSSSARRAPTSKSPTS